jgi:uncharacterized membrane protein YkvI
MLRRQGGWLLQGIFFSRFVRVYVVPGAVFQSVMVGGGYGTGREIVEYFTSFGLLGGLLGLGVAFVVLSLVLALTFELARHFRVYDYRSFFKLLLGRGWIAFEVLVILQFLLVLAVLASAAGNILRDNFGIPYAAGLSVMLLVIGVLTFYGRELIARVLTFWSFVLYAVFAVFFIAVLSSGWEPVSGAFAEGEVVQGWWRSGFQYAMYNLAVAPLLLYVARSFETRGETLKSGVVAGAIAIVPAFLFHIAFFVAYPEVLDQAIPVYWLISELGLTALLVMFSVVLFGTFIETGAGMLQGINERIDAWLVEERGRGLGRTAHAVLAVCAILVSAMLSFWGITSLIAQGYGTIAWGFFAVYMVPLVTVGIYRIATSDARHSAGAATESLHDRKAFDRGPDA